ncbi:MAG: STAS domain-containing protein [Planctomycetota bacterium]|jgi:anti-anti-sigma factor|nr:STAS domain-containing protein [Planctomycetota bacterium]MDP6502050.1 STAS domain-containing protein [Planctomycetota bacterium]
MKRLNISLEQKMSGEARVTVLLAGGFVDVSTEDEFSARMDKGVQQVLAGHSAALILSLKDLSYINSTGLAVVVDANRQLAERLALASVPDSIVQIAKLLGLDGHLNIFDTVDEAVNDFLK